ncbi:MAG: carboxypeptidase regulatory-like domain-containing protein [Sumerlaeia bacterium]
MKQNHVLAMIIALFLAGVGGLLIWKSTQPAVVDQPPIVSVTPKTKTAETPPYDPTNGTIARSTITQTKIHNPFAANDPVVDDPYLISGDGIQDQIAGWKPTEQEGVTPLTLAEAQALLNSGELDPLADREPVIVNGKVFLLTSQIPVPEIIVIGHNHNQTDITNSQGSFQTAVAPLEGEQALVFIQTTNQHRIAATGETKSAFLLNLETLPQELLIELVEVETFTVRVVDQVGTPIPQALVSYASYPIGAVLPSDSASSATLDLIEQVTNSYGETEVFFTPFQQYTLYASASIITVEQAISSSTSQSIVLNNQNPILVTMSLGITLDEDESTKPDDEEALTTAMVRGIVVDEEGNPYPMVNVLARSDADSVDSAYTTDENGTFILVLPEGSYTLFASPVYQSGYQESPQTKKISFTAKNPPSLIRFVMPVGDIVDGVVLDSEGLPIPGVTVTSSEQLRTTTVSESGVSQKITSSTTTTNKAGAFQFSGLPKNGSIRNLSFTAEGYEPHSRISVSMLESPLTITLKKVSGVIVYVVWEGGNTPVTEFSYRLGKSGFNDFEIDTNQQGRRVNSPEGKFELNELEQGDYRVEVNLLDADGEPLPIRDATSFSITGENEQQLFTLVMVGGYDVNGTVEEAESGVIVPGASVSFVPPWGGYNPDSILLKLDLEETTDASGRFRFEGIPPGRYTLQVEAEGLVQKVAYDFTIEAGAPPSSLTLPVYKGGKLFGYVTAEDGSAVEDAFITIASLKPNIDGWSRKGTQTDSSGYYEFLSVPAGAHYLFLNYPGQDASEHLDLSLGEEKQVDFDFSESVLVSGEVSVNGKPYHEPITLGLVNTSTHGSEWVGVNNSRYSTSLLPGDYKVKSSITTGEGETITVKKGNTTQTLDIDLKVASATLVVSFPEGSEFAPGKVVIQPENMGQRYAYPRFTLYKETQFLSSMAAGEYRATFITMNGEWIGDSGLVKITVDGENMILMDVTRKPKTNRIGGWEPNEITIYPTSKRLNITTHIKQAGPATIYLEYEKGRHAMACQSAVLYQDGSIISSDVHDAWAGNDVVGTQYYLTIPQYDPQANYELELTMRSDGGTDSTGSIYLSH